MLSATIKPYTLSVIMLSVVMLNVFKRNIVAPLLWLSGKDRVK